MPSFAFSPAAAEDLNGIAAHIAQDKPQAALRWLQSVQEACQILADNPALGELRSGFGVPGCRSFTVGSYVIFFRAAANGIEIARLVHGSRDMNDL